MEHPIRLAPALEAEHDGGNQFAERGEVVVVRGESASELPDPLDRSQLRAVGRRDGQEPRASSARKTAGRDARAGRRDSEAFAQPSRLRSAFAGFEYRTLAAM